MDFLDVLSKKMYVMKKTNFIPKKYEYFVIPTTRFVKVASFQINRANSPTK